MSEILNTKIKFAYLSYSDMLSKIESGELDAFDIVFGRNDTKSIYIISEDLEPIELRSRVYVYDSVSDAETALNDNNDTYTGQLVSIAYKGVYRGYIVNERDGKYIVAPLWEHPNPIDYDTLGNRPIINMIGTLDNPIIVSDLEDGNYNIKGQYKISDLIETVYLSGSDALFIVKKTEDSINIKMITSDNITDYQITNGNIVSNKYVTEDYLKSNNYATSDYVDNKISALEQLIKEDMEQYMDSILGEVLDEKIDSRIDEKIIPTTNSQINDLFKS